MCQEEPEYRVLCVCQEEEPEYRMTAARKKRLEEFFLRKKTDEGFDLMKLTMSKRHSRKPSALPSLPTSRNPSGSLRHQSDTSRHSGNSSRVPSQHPPTNT